MHRLLLACTLLITSIIAPGNARAETTFSVDLLSPGREYLYVDDSWNERADCIEAKVSVSADTPYKSTVLKAYFYSADGKLLHFENKPTSQGDGNGAMVKWPDDLKPGKKYSFFFGIPKKINSGSSKWKRAIVVFGATGSPFDAKIYPKDDLTKFEFAEKASMKKQ